VKGPRACVLIKASDAVLDVQLIGAPVLRPPDDWFSPVHRLVGGLRWCGLADRCEQVLSGVGGVQDELAVVLRPAHSRQRPIGIVDNDQPGAGADGRSGGCRVVRCEIEDVGNVVVETDTDDPPVREGASGRLVLTAEFFLGGYLLR
jgi:hypothetical protein